LLLEDIDLFPQTSCSTPRFLLDLFAIFASIQAIAQYFDFRVRFVSCFPQLLSLLLIIGNLLT
jgi:hypothetical protein